MDPQSSAFALGLLFGAAKVMTIGAVGFGIGWWRTRARLRALEAERSQPSLTEERLDRLEQGLDYMASQLDRLVEGQLELGRQLAAGEVAHPALPPRQPRAAEPPGEAARGVSVTPR
jgi:hypothetical protein